MATAEEQNDNEARWHALETVDTLELRYDRVADHLAIGGKFNSLDIALDMLARATRSLEAQQRKVHALEVQGAMLDQARAVELARKVRGGG
jgi:tRNA G37 N-methylase TrmD